MFKIYDKNQCTLEKKPQQKSKFNLNIFGVLFQNISILEDLTRG